MTEQRICPSCFNKNDYDLTYCTKCGTDIGKYYHSDQDNNRLYKTKENIKKGSFEKKFLRGFNNKKHKHNFK